MSKPLFLTNKINHYQVIMILSFSLFIAFAALYIFISPNQAHQPWDSLDYAYSTEANGIRVIRGNHPLGHLILFLAFSVAQTIGYTGRALPVLQVANGIIGGLAVALFYTLLASILKLSSFSALGFAIILGGSYSFWFFAGTGDIYIVALLFSLLAWILLIKEIALRKNPFPIAPGILTGLAILSHQLNVMLLPVGITLILLTPMENDHAQKIKIQQIISLTISASAIVILGYFVLGYIAISSFSPLKILEWARGYFGDPSYGRYLSTQYFSTARTTATQAILAYPVNRAELIRNGILTVLIVLMIFGLLANYTLGKDKRLILIAAALQCLITWPLIFWWEPQNLKFWLLALLPLSIFLALAFETALTKIQFIPNLKRAVIFLPLLLGILTFSINTKYGMWDQHNDSTENSIVFQQAMDAWLSHSAPEDVLITLGDLIPNLLYWGNRPNTVNLYRSLQSGQASSDDFSDLRREIDQALCSHHRVFLAPAASEYIPDDQLAVVDASREDLRLFFSSYTAKGQVAFWYKNIFDKKRLPVYALTQPGTCAN